METLAGHPGRAGNAGDVGHESRAGHSGHAVHADHLGPVFITQKMILCFHLDFTMPNFLLTEQIAGRQTCIPKVETEELCVVPQ